MRLLLVILCLLFASATMVAQSSLAILTEDGKSMTISLNEVRHVLRNASGNAILIAPNSGATTKTQTPFNTIFTASCGSLISVTATDIAGQATKPILVNRMYIKQVVPGATSAKSVVHMRDQLGNFYCDNGYATVSSMVTQCAAGGSGVTITAGPGILVSAGPSYVISNAGDTDASDDITTASTAGGDLSGPFSNLAIVPGAVAPSDIAQSGATNGQVLKWNGSAWAPANESGGGATDWSYRTVTSSVGSVIFTISGAVPGNFAHIRVVRNINELKVGAPSCMDCAVTYNSGTGQFSLNRALSSGEYIFVSVR